MPASPLHIGIIGAGLGGLCLAQGLKRAGIPFTVFEQDAALDSRPQGYRIRINDDGQQALARCLPPEHYRLFRASCALPGLQGRFVDTNLAPANGRAPISWRRSASDDDDDGDLRANRLTLRELLLAGIEDRVHFGKRLAGCQATAQGISARFEDGGCWQGSLLVGADGAQSRLRAQLAPQALPQESGALCLYGKTRLTTELAGLDAGPAVAFADGFILIVDPLHFDPLLAARAREQNCRLSPVTDYLYWACLGDKARLGHPERAEDLLIGLKRQAESWHPLLQALLAAASPADMTLTSVRTLLDWTPWPAGPATLLGDAIHPMSPAGGLGANSALQDAADLSEQIALAARGESTLTDAIARYEKQLRDRALEALRQSSAGETKLLACAKAE